MMPTTHCRFCIRNPTYALLLALLVLPIFAGCRKNRRPSGDVTGKVTFESTPVTEGFVTFQNLGRGRSQVVPLDANGQYLLREVEIGEYTVTIEPPEPKRPNETTNTPDEIRAQMATYKAPDPKNIPRQFRSSQSSPLKRSVVQGGNEFDFELSTKQK